MCLNNSTLVLWYVVEIENISLLIVDNLDCHVLAKSVNFCTEKLCSEVCSFLKNMTSYCQQLDIGVMGSLKAKIWSMWLVNTIKAKTALEKKRLAIELTSETWNEISTSCVFQAWDKLVY
jgi:DDE superfamily endonuclease